MKKLIFAPSPRIVIPFVLNNCPTCERVFDVPKTNSQIHNCMVLSELLRTSFGFLPINHDVANAISPNMINHVERVPCRVSSDPIDKINWLPDNCSGFTPSPLDSGE